MRKRNTNIILLLLITLSAINFKCKDDKETVAPPPQKDVDVKFYLSTADEASKFALQETGISSGKQYQQTITIDKTETYQTIDGFGFSLTGGSALHIYNMSQAKRTALLQELFSIDQLAVGYLRVSLGASDLDEKVFSYNDLSTGETDVNLEKFTLAEDQKHLIPVLKEILAINQNIKIMASPWSAPTWMKDNKNSKGGSLLPEYYSVYANYFVKYVQEMQKEGITIDAITIQNEPLHPGNNPSMYMTAEAQADFVRDHLGPAFQRNSITTKIIIYDHNADRTDYPLSILNDTEANKYVDGSAFHLYGGSINDLSKLHDAHPDKNLYFTEQWIGAPGNFGGDLRWHGREILIGATRNWCKVVLEWNLAANTELKPHTDGGCTQCLGALTIDGDNVKRNPAYYIIAHASKFVSPESKRIKSNFITELPNVAFELPDGKIALIVLNDSDNNQPFNIEVGEESYSTSLSAGSLATIVF